MRPLTFRRQIALWTAAFSAGVVLIFAAGTLWNLYNEQLEAIDVDLRQDTQLLCEMGDTTSMIEAVDHINAEHPWMAIAVLRADGRRLENTPRLPTELVTGTLDVSAKPRSVQVDDIHWRIFTGSHGDATLIVGFNLAEADETLTELLGSYLLSLPLVLAAVGLGGWWIAGRMLAPVRNLTHSIEAIQANRLDARVPASLAKDEMGRLTDVFNAMMARLERAFQQSQRFAADASHELRTPLTVMRAEVEQGLRDAALSPTHLDRLISLQEEISFLERITENLLLLASFDGSRDRLEKHPVNFTELAQDTAQDAELLAEAEGIRLEIDIADNLTVEGDPSLLRRLLLNILHNAISHNEPDGSAALSIIRETHSGQPAVVVRMSNTGPGIPPELRDRIFERFFQADASRAERHGHGLGLSLCREIAHAHGGRFELSADSRPGRTEFICILPAMLS